MALARGRVTDRALTSTGLSTSLVKQFARALGGRSGCCFDGQRRRALDEGGTLKPAKPLWGSAGPAADDLRGPYAKLAYIVLESLGLSTHDDDFAVMFIPLCS
jgi:hypothetical protein